MKETIEIIKVKFSQCNALQSLCEQTFYETYEAVNTAENMQNYVLEHFSKEKLELEINNSDIEYYFAIYKEQIAGYVKVNFGQEQTDLKEHNTAEIERIYVTRKFHGNQIGKLLYKKAFELAVARKAEYLWLGVWEKNEKAIGFYKKMGFVAFDTHIFMLGDDKQIDLMMKKELY